MEKILKVIVTIFLFIISLAIQLFLFDNMSLFGVKPNILLISIIVVSLYTNIYASTIYSFGLGFIVDLIFGGSGMFTISYTIIGMLLGLISEDYMKENYLSTIVLTALSVIVFEVILYFDSMIISSSYISFFFLIKQLILSILLNVVLQENKKTILNTFKINISMCLIGVIMGEFLTSKAGIGYLILYGSQVFNLDLVMTGVFLLTIISIIMYKVISKNTDK